MRAWILIFATACTADVSVGTTVQPAIAANAIAANAITTNAIAANAIAANAIAANAIAANAIAANGILTGAVTDPTVALALEDPNARIFMRYLVGCALAPGQEISWTGRTGLQETWKGLLGLCPAWQTGPADVACRQRVSACILARNNAFGVSVAFSMRGTDGTNPLALGDRVPAHDHIPRTNREVASLSTCMRALDGELRDCGWRADSVGVCTPGTTVSIASGNYGDACSGDWLGVEGSTDEVLRVCPGTSACDRRFAIASVDNSCGSAAPAIDFVCPDEGHYAVMRATFDAHGRPDGEVGSTMVEENLCRTLVGDVKPGCRTSWDWTCEAEAETVCRYPATEAQVFRWREGSFYGDIFGANGLDPAKPQVRVNPKTLVVQSLTKDGVWIDGNELSNAFVGVVFRSMFACASSNWKAPEAYVARRVCAGPDPNDPSMYTRNCAAAYAGACARVCGTLDALPLGDYDAANCLADERKWPTPMTTLLAMPSDAVPDPSVNGTVSSTPILTSQPW